MAKSKETFLKREKQKKRLQRKTEKREKLAERRANPDSDKSFESMLAYLDENGNLTDTPPDPSILKKLN